jgi:uncharacterized repeat protein (TIGR01451 family)
MLKITKLSALLTRRQASGERQAYRRRRVLPGGFAAVAAVTAGLAGAAAPAAASGNGLDANPAIVLAKSASVRSYSAAGTVITYTFQVTNTGNAPLRNVTVTDPMPGLSTINCGTGTPVIALLNVGASGTCTATYTTTAQDVSAGSITNTAAVRGTWAPGRTVSYKSSVTVPEPGFPYRCVNPPFYFLSESTSHTGPTTLFGSTASPAVYAAVPAPPYPGVYNAIGFDPSGPNQGYIFGMTKAGSKLIKIDDTGAVVPGYPVAVTGYPTTPPNPVVGEFDNTGTYWVTNGGGGTLAYRINVNGAIPSVIGAPVALSAPFAAYDWTYASGYLWGLQGKQIYRVKAASPGIGTVAHWPLGFGVVAPRVYGAAWTFGNGDLGFSNNATGTIYEIRVTSPAAPTPTFALAGVPYTGPQTGNYVNDGTACAAKGTNLGIAGSGPATAAAGSTVTWNLTVTNKGPANSSGFLVNDVIKGRMSGLTTATPGCSVTHKGGEVQCAEGTLDDGDPFTVTLSAAMPQADGACVVNSAAVAGNEADHHPANNTASVQTCTTAPTWTVKPGGSVKASSGGLTLQDTKTGTVITCKPSDASGTLQSGTGLSGTGIGSIKTMSLGTCTGPAGLALKPAANALPWAVNALSYNGGVTTGTITGIDASLSGTGCSATLDGTAAGADNGQVDVSYANSNGTMQLLASGGNLTFSDVQGCLGLINSGDAATLTGSYTMSPKQLITSP